MNIYQLEHVLIWCAVINYIILLIWFGVFYFAHDWLFKLHTRWFKLTIEHFDAINYAGIAIYKIGVLLLNLVPLLALSLTNQ